MKENITQDAQSIMALPPKFITFTGVDESTSVEALRAISLRYPVEWGVLFSPRHQGIDNRYPSIKFIQHLTSVEGLQLSAHLCGGYARELISDGRTSLDQAIRAHFDRVQINTADPNIDLNAVKKWAEDLEVSVIVQCREGFPNDGRVSWLYDVSGGRGVSPGLWPPAPPDVLVGYAGGINPGNVLQVIDHVGAVCNAYWLDMETGVRSVGDLFDLRKCLAVCEAVFGVREGAAHPGMLPTGLTKSDLLALAGSLEAGAHVGVPPHGEGLSSDAFVRTQAAALIRVVATRGLLDVLSVNESGGP